MHETKQYNLARSPDIHLVEQKGHSSESSLQGILRESMQQDSRNACMTQVQSIFR